MCATIQILKVHKLFDPQWILIKHNVLDLNGELIIWIYVQVTSITLTHTLTVTDIKKGLRGTELILYLKIVTIIRFSFQNGSNPDFVRYTMYSNLLLHYVALLQNMNFIAYISVDTE